MKNLPQSSDSYQVYFFTCPAYKPFQFAIHPWVITVKNGTTTRWEIIHRRYKGKERFGYLYKNFYSKPTQGIKKHSFSSEYWDSILLGSFSGDESSLAKRIVEFIEVYSPDYLYKNTYRYYPGPNSNTYIAWILNKFPEANISLPWNAFGKNYK